MCTAISFSVNDHYFGRTLDLEYTYGEKVTVCPRQFSLYLRSCAPLLTHNAFIGMATLANNTPLYYDGVNEFGLCVAALNFPGNARYNQIVDGMINIAQFELIPWILGSFRTVSDVVSNIEQLNITDVSYSEEYPASSLHWMVSDCDRSIVIEQTESGLNWYENSVGVLANNPPFPYQLDALSLYTHLSPMETDNNLSLIEPQNSRGTGMFGLPGDLTSKSRFIRASVFKHFSVCKDSESAAVSQFFHILDSVSQVQGSVRVGNQYVKTVYSSCCNSVKCIYYYKTYENSQITAVRLLGHDLNSSEITQYPLRKTQQFKMEN